MGHHFGHAFATRACGGKAFQIGGPVLVFAQGNKFHFGRYYTVARIMHLRDILAGFCAARLSGQLKPQRVKFRVFKAALPEGRTGSIQHFGVAARFDPLSAQGRKAFANIDGGCGVGIGAGCVVDIYWRVGLAAHICRCFILRYFAHGHADIGARAGDVYFLAIGQRSYGMGINLSSLGCEVFARFLLWLFLL